MALSQSSISDLSIESNLQSVRSRIQSACEASGRSPDDVELIAVSKTKPLELLKEAYENNQRIFGENYVQELVEKAPEMPIDVKWHFIGTLQSNKASMLVKKVVPNSSSFTIETVTSKKLANKLNNAMKEFEDKKLDIFVQVNTSGEESKGGVTPADVVSLCKDITESCDNLNLKGLMTIGAIGDLSCFQILVKCRDEVASELDRSDLCLSMGMSGDFETAISEGATHVRVGSTIFGARDYSKK
eukprot:CAMPEP_0194136666 /NCGR_PEP_ID=MMETSP0152-20130528/6669_1 /TAXON_ID=1049557 /ORGANISM="Thalassiothrix antarctica, Strain L6-D1" /LENGTH=243 /DNA_ID=CAMNT_0038833417 /DNA_START=168 /DNA_END=899 /DNA_ORIENTATION=-